MKKYLLVSTPPTPNGDFHLGHLAGPYLQADVLKKVLLAQGHEVKYISYLDVNQTYVDQTAKRKRVSCTDLIAETEQEMTSTLEAYRIDFDSFTLPSPKHDQFVSDFLTHVAEQDGCELLTCSFAKDMSSSEYIVEANNNGFCSFCSCECCGYICESCGNLLSENQLLKVEPSDDQAATDSFQIDHVNLMKFFPEIKSYFDSLAPNSRKNYLRLLNEMADLRYLNLPLQYPTSRGIIASDDGLLCYNPWAEMCPGLVNLAIETTGDINVWKPGSDWQIIQFYGYDNTIFCGVLQQALLLCHGDHKLPDNVITNEFLELNNQKFSTSRNNLIWASDLLTRYSCDFSRFLLYQCVPENDRSNFDEAAYVVQVYKFFINPYVATLESLGHYSSSSNLLGESLQNYISKYSALISRYSRYLSPEHYSLTEYNRMLSNTCLMAKKLVEAGKILEASFIALELIPRIISPLAPDFTRFLCDSMGLTATSLSLSHLESSESMVDKFSAKDIRVAIEKSFYKHS